MKKPKDWWKLTPEQYAAKVAEYKAKHQITVRFKTIEELQLDASHYANLEKQIRAYEEWRAQQ